VLKEKHDTTYVATHDTIPAPFPQTEYVEKEMTWWQQTLMNLGSAVLIVLFGLACWWIGGAIRNFKDRWV
jgi:hypothetical protein